VNVGSGNLRTSQRVYRAPYLYIAQSLGRQRLLRIGQTMRPDYELQRMRQRYAAGVRMIAHVRAYALLAPILWQRFGYCATSHGGQWFTPDRKLVTLAGMFRLRGPENLVTADALLALFGAIFPDEPYAGIARYRICEAYIMSARGNGKY